MANIKLLMWVLYSLQCFNSCYIGELSMILGKFQLKYQQIKSLIMFHKLENMLNAVDYKLKILEDAAP